MVPTLTLLLAMVLCPCIARAQGAKPTATQDIQLSAFTGVSGVYTGLSGGRNISLTVGADLALTPWNGVLPSLELRGTYPIDRGNIVSQKDIFGGLRLDFYLSHRIHPYGDFLFGRGEMNYASGGYNFNDFTYLVSTSYVYSPGAGFDYDLSNHLVIKLDGQIQRWGSVPTASGSLYSTAGTIGLVYRFGGYGIP